MTILRNNFPSTLAKIEDKKKKKYQLKQVIPNNFRSGGVVRNKIQVLSSF